MSRIGKKEIDIPKDVSVVLENEKIIVKGKYGSLEKKILALLKKINIFQDGMYQKIMINLIIHC